MASAALLTVSTAMGSVVGSLAWAANAYHHRHHAKHEALIATVQEETLVPVGMYALVALWGVALRPPNRAC